MPLALILTAALTLSPRVELATARAASAYSADRDQGASKANKRGGDPVEAAAVEPNTAMQPTDPSSATPDDQVASHPDCPNDEMAMANDERHLIDDPYGRAFTGAQHGKVKLVVFVDYACPACRVAQPVLDRLVADDPDLQVVYRIVDNEPGSTGVSGVSLQVARLDNGWQAFHHALDSGDSVADDAIGKALDAAHLKKDCYLPSDKTVTDIAVLDELRRNREFLFQRKLTSFPSWVIGKGPVHAGIDYATLRSAIAKAEAQAR